MFIYFERYFRYMNVGLALLLTMTCVVRSDKDLLNYEHITKVTVFVMHQLSNRQSTHKY